MTPEEDIAIQRRETGLGEPLAVLEPVEKMMVGETPSGSARTRPEGGGSGKPHYTKLLVYEDRLVLAVGCCKPLTVLAAEIDGLPFFGKTILSEHSEEKGGKLLYAFEEKGGRLMIDLKRGESPRFQRIVFVI